MLDSEKYYHFENEKYLYKFESILKRNGLDFPNNVSLDLLAYVILEIHGMHKKEIDNVDFAKSGKEIREMMGLNDFVRKIVSLEDHPSFPVLIPHLHLLLSNTQLAQNSSAQSIDDKSNKLFELLMALAIMPLSNEVTLDHPEKSKGDNPDILFKVENTVWGIACKVINSDKALSYWDNLKKGVEQIENSPAHKGFVMFNLRNIIPHEHFLGIKHNGGQFEVKGYLDPKQAEAELINVATPIMQNISRDIPCEDIKNLFKYKKALPISINYLSTVTSIINTDHNLFVFYRVLNMFSYLGTSFHNYRESKDGYLIELLNRGSQDKLFILNELTYPTVGLT